jgi:integrative and conjugative element protein (TIGR02256 family)
MTKAHVWHFPRRECFVSIPANVLGDLKRKARDYLPNETGGTLVGHYSHDLRVACVLRVLGVRSGGQQGPSWFYRPPDSIDGQLAEIYAQSGGSTYYLGEWHSHPYAHPRPSSTDLNTLIGLARSRSVATDTPILIIVGGSLARGAPTVCFLGLPSGETAEADYVGTRGGGSPIHDRWAPLSC